MSCYNEIQCARTVANYYSTIYNLISYHYKPQLAALMDSIREDVSVLTLLAEVLCLLDMIVNSFAYNISTKAVDQYSRPEFTGNKAA